MHATVLRMLSTNSLTAFSAATTTAPAKTQPTRLVRELQTAPQGAQAKSAIPNQLPTVAPPRGSLLNLSV